jgi:hypothetical protein
VALWQQVMGRPESDVSLIGVDGCNVMGGSLGWGKEGKHLEEEFEMMMMVMLLLLLLLLLMMMMLLLLMMMKMTTRALPRRWPPPFARFSRSHDPCRKRRGGRRNMQCGGC